MKGGCKKRKTEKLWSDDKEETMLYNTRPCHRRNYVKKLPRPWHRKKVCYMLQNHDIERIQDHNIVEPM